MLSDLKVNRRASGRLKPRASYIKPRPIVIPASQDFDGNDGPWSSFTLQIGSPAQDIKVLISTAAGQTLTVIPQGCTASDPADCNTTRGLLFDPAQSSTWKQNNLTANGIFTLHLETNLGYSGNTDFGYDTVALGWQGSGGPSLDQQIIGGIATKEFYLGLFGLSPRPSNFTTFDDPVPSYIANLKTEGIIPSLSWAYSAGNQYRSGPSLGSLTLGGYDTSRFISNNVSFAFDDIDAKDLTVNLEYITCKAENRSTSLLDTPIQAFIDSTIPYLYLPLSVCEAFEDAFGITWDDTVQAYLINDTQHSALQKQNATTTFSLGTADSTVDISLPYAAFDLTAKYPLLTNASRYFPLMRAANESQYTLGRTFLQEAYLIADYEKRNFSISQCDWSGGTQPNIVAITSPSETDSRRALSKGQIAGIIAGAIAGLAISIVLISKTIHKHRRSKAALGVKTSASAGVDTPESSSERESIGLHEIDGQQHHGSEIDGTKLPGHEINGYLHHGTELEARGQRFELPASGTLATEMPQ